MEVVNLDKLLAELNSPHGVPHLVPRGRPEADAHHVGHDQHQSAADARFSRKSNLIKVKSDLLSRYEINYTADH